MAIVRDVTTEQRRIEELASFAAVAAHDLKSPLAAVQGWMEVAEDALEGDPVTAVEALERGRHATDRMSREIDDWLTYNVAREGAVQPEPVALQPCPGRIVANYPGADFVIETPDTVRADPTLLRHLLVNLIGNAVKYTQPGERPSIDDPQLLRQATATGCGSTSWMPGSASPRVRRRRSSSRSVVPPPWRQLRGLGSGPRPVQAHRAPARRADQRRAQRGPRHHDHGDPPRRG